MSQAQGDTTSPTLLGRVSDTRDGRAWVEFVARYDPLLRQWCRYCRLDPETSDELCQRIWVRLWPIMTTYRYDPGRRFRGWLWRFFRSRAADMLADRKANRAISLEGLPAGGALLLSDAVPARDLEDEGGPNDSPPALLSKAREVQETVRARVDPETWHAFWLTRIEDRPVREVADTLGKSYAAVYYGSLRVERRLRQEGQRWLGRLTDPASRAVQRHRSG